MTERITSADIRQRLRVYFGASEWALLHEVIDATGAQHTRSADAIAMNTWPSRGLAVHGIEIKISRSDFLGELKKPEKAHSIARYCDYWWLAAPENVVNFGELPESWGLLAPVGNTLKVVKQATKFENPAPLDRLFVASVLRNAGRVDEGMIRAAVEAKTKAEIDSINERVEATVQRRMREFYTLKSAVDEFEKHSGIRISDGWHGGDVGAKVRVINAIGIGKYGIVESLANQLSAASVAIKQALKDAGLSSAPDQDAAT